MNHKAFEHFTRSILSALLSMRESATFLEQAVKASVDLDSRGNMDALRATRDLEPYFRALHATQRVQDMKMDTGVEQHHPSTRYREALLDFGWKSLYREWGERTKVPFPKEWLKEMPRGHRLAISRLVEEQERIQKTMDDHVAKAAAHVSKEHKPSKDGERIPDGLLSALHEKTQEACGDEDCPLHGQNGILSDGVPETMDDLRRAIGKSLGLSPEEVEHSIRASKNPLPEFLTMFTTPFPI